MRFQLFWQAEIKNWWKKSLLNQNQDAVLLIWDMKMMFYSVLKETSVKMLESIKMEKSHYTKQMKILNN